MDLFSFLGRHPNVIRLLLSRVRGSSPRDAGTEMFVTCDTIIGTIGGGQLENIAIDTARNMLERGDLRKVLDLPLGPEIGQCCGGRVEITFTRMSQSDKQLAKERVETATLAQPHVYVLGAGHVGRALADLLQFLPVRTILIDPRVDELKQCKADVETRVSAVPEHDIATAPAHSAFVVLTHDHALDFLLTSEALAKGNAAYVGMIGSDSKRATFKNWCDSQCKGLTIDKLVCPIGAGGSRDKRPQVIAAAVVAEVITELTTEKSTRVPKRGKRLQKLGNQPDTAHITALGRN